MKTGAREAVFKIRTQEIENIISDIVYVIEEMYTSV